MLVKDIMNRKFIKVLKSEKASDIRKKLMMYNAKSVIVTDNEKIAGVITNNDIIKTLDLNETASSIMDRDFITVYEDASIQEAAQILLDHSFVSLPVTDSNNKLVGTISESDVVKDVVKGKPVHPKLSQERITVYLAMTEDRERELYWLEKCNQYNFPCATTQVGESAERLAIKMRESAIVAAIARSVIKEDLREKMAVSNAVKDVYAQINLINPGLGGGFKIAITRGNGIIVVAAYGRCGHALANGPQTVNVGYSVI
ncbi:MAG: CBS domain-containing protein [Candidatus Muirbacterium halophilum]|nr:CBS domain-containing protein [Candidatus Muirbacterium halophilum]MCK9476416.1 CBS domain-containing protein [Candidatus Muirbacterium halophilum]